MSSSDIIDRMLYALTNLVKDPLVEYARAANARTARVPVHAHEIPTTIELSLRQPGIEPIVHRTCCLHVRSCT